MLLEALIACAGVSMRAKLQPRIMRCELSAFEWATIERMLPTKPRGVPQPSVSGYVRIKSTS